MNCPARSSVVDGTTDGIPEGLDTLPLVQQVMGVAVEQKARVECSPTLGVGVGVEKNFTGRLAASGFRLAAFLDAFDEDGPHRTELPVEGAVREARQVGPIIGRLGHGHLRIDKRHTFC